jgi:hypothetical protein
VLKTIEEIQAACLQNAGVAPTSLPPKTSPEPIRYFDYWKMSLDELDKLEKEASEFFVVTPKTDPKWATARARYRELNLARTFKAEQRLAREGVVR